MPNLLVRSLRRSTGLCCIRIRGVLCRSGRDNVELIDFLMQSSIK